MKTTTQNRWDRFLSFHYSLTS